MSSDDDEDKKFGVSRKIILAAIASLLVATALVIVLHLYARYLVKRRERRRSRSALYPPSTTQGPSAPDEANLVTNPPKTGLDQSIIASLPLFIYKPTHQLLDHGEATECSVCLSNIDQEAAVRLLPNCKHLFHGECIDLWLSSHLTCPICRTMAEPRLQPEQSAVGTAGVDPSAPPLEEKVGGSSSRLSSFRKKIGGERSSKRVQSCEEIGAEDLERQ